MKSQYLFDAVVLIQVLEPGVGSLQQMYPDQLNVVDELPMLVASSTPLVDASKPVVFTFNVGRYFCYSLYAAGKDYAFTISVLSAWPFAFFYHLFLKSAAQNLTRSGVINDSSASFHYVTSLMRQWPYYYETTLEFMFPVGPLEFEFDIDHFTFAQFNPCLFFSSDECRRLWKAMVLGEPILFLVPHAGYACRCCFAAMALLAPVQFKDPMAIWLMPTDPRFAALREGKSDLKMVACPISAAGELKSQFKHVFKIGEKLRNGSPDGDVLKAFQKYNLKILVLIQEEIDSRISTDPYFNVTKKNLMTEHFRKVYQSQARKHQLPSIDELETFMGTKSFKNWRYRSDGANRFRDAILSTTPTIDLFTWRPESELKTILSAIEKSKAEFEHDAHVMAVLKRHEDAVNSLLKSD